MQCFGGGKTRVTGENTDLPKVSDKFITGTVSYYYTIS